MSAALAFAILANSATGAEPRLEFEQPAPNSTFVVGTEIPLLLLAEGPGEIFATAEVFVDGQPAGTANYCCPLCPCFAPQEGMALELRLPRNRDDPGASVWRELTNLAPGFHHVTASAAGSRGTSLRAGPIPLVVLAAEDLQLRVALSSEQELRFVLPGGSLVFGGFDMWLSHDLHQWVRLGPFEPGNVAAFFRDQPDFSDPRPRYYQALPANNARTTDP